KNPAVIAAKRGALIQNRKRDIGLAPVEVSPLVARHRGAGNAAILPAVSRIKSLARRPTRHSGRGMGSTPPNSPAGHAERCPLTGTFAISRGTKTQASVVVAELTDGRHRGRGECVPYARYGETVEGVVEAIAALGDDIAHGLDRGALQQTMRAGAARNALDCAFWDLAAKRAGRRVHDLAGLPPLKPLVTAYTISLATPAAMAEQASKAAGRALLKVKLGGAEDPARISAVRRAAPRAQLIVDAN